MYVGGADIWDVDGLYRCGSCVMEERTEIILHPLINQLSAWCNSGTGNCLLVYLRRFEMGEVVTSSS
jgi:hypothetical protein